ncbi:hypothetical protein GLOTRDRAFT_141524 [Gloeophyllum trabeum ATCC 11539]|uniref:F-box domain-containing protein n=1 Tax=Gloeophyllum trabeum (strain ATCC 11539 / FP-39264 / Madison 617) TaxID=670483 RepID=S7PRF6_GLOTA|nr:uncharacterized protein GLOTRDRAFT_141524 [Gloeophyllum trabeum ATCC 11539]EPQ50441.1 hypothetical protein GLOTRDRAFT_141524 [Gloeophyllum trabeum ATCC 11539]
MSILDLPPEVLGHIIALAPTAYPALAAVSRSFNSASAPFSLHTVHVSGLPAIRRLIAQLEAHKARAESEGRAYVGKVAHLFLCDLPPRTARVPGVDDVLRSCACDARADAHALLQAYIALLPLVAPALRALSVLSYNPHITPYRVLLDTPFPRLRVLEVRFTAIAYCAQMDPARAPTMPALTHLHLAFGVPPTMADEPAGLVEMAAACAPGLREVRFTNVRLGRACAGAVRRMLGLRGGKRGRAESVMTLVEEAQGEEDSETQSDTDSTAAVADFGGDGTDVDDQESGPRLAAVYVQPAPPGGSVPWWTVYQREMLAELKSLARGAVFEAALACLVGDGEKRGAGTGTLVVLDPPADGAGGYEAWRTRWEAGVGFLPEFGEVIGGGEGAEKVKVDSAVSATSPWRMY